MLRLQARRLTHPEAIAAVGDSVRRIRTIALVHEALSREPGDDVTFIEIVRPLLRLAEEGLQSVDRPVRFTVHGDGGRIPAAIATPLSVVLTELLQNAVDHGFPEGSAGGSVVVQLANADGQLRLTVVDDGRGVESGFRLEDATGLGLSIVRTLVTTELDGRIEMRPLTGRRERVGLESPAPCAARSSNWSYRSATNDRRVVTPAARRDSLIASCGWVIGVLVFFRDAIFSGFDTITGDEGDARLVVFLHEHWWQVWHGERPWRTPPMFHPVSNVLSYSDTFLLDQLLYTPLRMLGVEPFIAYQLCLSR